MTTDSALIAALEHAPAADRGLDALIALEIERERFKHVQLTADSDLQALAKVYGIAHYTASIDAALTLVPAGYDWDVGFLRDNGKATAHVMWEHGVADETMAKRINCIVGAAVNWAEHARGATPAIALCLAALKSRNPHDHKL